MSHLTQSETWTSLAHHYDAIKDIHMRKMFDQDENRFNKFSIQVNDILYDYSKNRINDETIKLLLDLAKEVNLSQWIEKMFSGEPINHTEHRAVLHTALRDRGNQSIVIDGVDIMPEITRERERVKQLAEKIRTRKWRGATNQAITDVVNIGIGGSHLGTRTI
jgi:glucose-6-phosphate isomerase